MRACVRVFDSGQFSFKGHIYVGLYRDGTLPYSMVIAVNVFIMNCVAVGRMVYCHVRVGWQYSLGTGTVDSNQAIYFVVITFPLHIFFATECLFQRHFAKKAGGF